MWFGRAISHVAKHTTAFLVLMLVSIVIVYLFSYEGWLNREDSALEATSTIVVATTTALMSSLESVQ